MGMGMEVVTTVDMILMKKEVEGMAEGMAVGTQGHQGEFVTMKLLTALKVTLVIKQKLFA
jgi:hypothetical protein